MDAELGQLRQRMDSILRATPELMAVLRTIRDQQLPDSMVFSGAVYQPVLNHLTGRPPSYGNRDYDVAYYDARDLSYDAEDAVIRRVAGALSSPLRERTQVRNQARVHLWFEEHFGEPYAPLADSAEALTRFPSASFAVGARLEADDGITIFAPFGLEDLFALRLRPNPLRATPSFAKTVASVEERWPEVQITFP
jgi:hypothetical protein